MRSEENIALVGDLRIDNRSELLADLSGAGNEHSATDDAGLLLASWRHWGPVALDRLVGDFAFALFDRKLDRLYLVRDFAGQRPLHFTPIDGGIAFASTPGALARLNGAAKLRFDEWAAYTGVIPQSGDGSMFEGVRRVEPGHLVIIDRGRIHPPFRYWQPCLTPLRIGFEQAVEQTRALLDRAVSDQLRNSYRVTAGQLSSGLDSGAVMTSAGEQSTRPLLAITGEALEPGPPPPHTHHVGEGRYAAMVTARYPLIEHRIVRVPTPPMFGTMTTWNALLDQPVRSFENMHWLDATYAAAAEAGAGVMLTGAYGNFSISFDGIARFAELARGGRILTWLREARRFRQDSGARWRGVLAYSIGPHLPGLAWTLVKRASGIRAYEALDAAFLRGDNPVINILKSRAQADGFKLDDQMARTTLEGRMMGINWVDNALLTHAFRRRWKVESRDPTQDKRLVEFILRLPSEVFLRNGRPRSLGREMLRGRVPDEVLDLKTRGVQGNDWLKAARASHDDFAAELDHLEATSALTDLLDVARMREALAQLNGAGNDLATIIALRGSFLRTLGLAHWARTRFFG
ncbi:MAG: asparagine synthetase B family protein [Sphingomicrobium sp.]